MVKLIVHTEEGHKYEFKLKEGVTRIGRSSVADIMIADPSVSRLHCEIEVKEDGIYVRDLDSSNGTFLDGKPITYAQLLPGQVLQVGSVQITVEQSKFTPSFESLTCYNHPHYPASMRCRECGKMFCGACVHVIRRVGGKYLRLCPICGGQCEPITAVEAGSVKNTLNTFFRRLFGKKTQDVDSQYYE